jgi:hypothetical protein
MADRTPSSRRFSPAFTSSPRLVVGGRPFNPQAGRRFSGSYMDTVAVLTTANGGTARRGGRVAGRGHSYSDSGPA